MDTDTPQEPASYELIDDIGVITMHSGKVNALSYALVSCLLDALAQAEEGAASAIVITGKPGILSAGFDLKEVMKGPAERDALIAAGGEFFINAFATRKPVVVACSGHAIAGGAIFPLVADSAIGVEGPFQIGLNEVSIGVPLPEFGVALTRFRLLPNFAERAALGDLYSAAQAAEIGYLQELVPPEKLLARALERASELAGRNAEAYAVTKERARRELLTRFLGKGLG